MMGFTDSDYARDQDDRKSTSRYVFMLGTRVVSWSSKNNQLLPYQQLKLNCTCNFMSCQAIWLKRILEEIQFKQQGATSIYCDNSSTIKLSRNPVLHGRSKHIDVKYHFLRDLAKDGVINLIFCRSEDQVADIFTKPLKTPLFHKLRELLGVCSLG